MPDVGIDTRSTLAIDEDVLAAAKALEEQRRCSLGAVVSDLARQSLRRPRASAERNGIPLLDGSPDAPSVTLGIVSALRGEWP